MVKANYSIGKYKNKWAVFCGQSCTWIFSEGGKRGAKKKANELNNGI